MLQWLIDWYHSNCAYCIGGWESDYGIKIETLENPGWSVEIDLAYTSMEGKEFTEIRFESDDHNWLFCEVRDNKFHGASDPLKLEIILTVFKGWVESFQE